MAFKYEIHMQLEHSALGVFFEKKIIAANIKDALWVFSQKHFEVAAMLLKHILLHYKDIDGISKESMKKLQDAIKNSPEDSLWRLMVSKEVGDIIRDIFYIVAIDDQYICNKLQKRILIIRNIA